MSGVIKQRSMAYSKYKDLPPEVTIQKIKECFKTIGINLEERIIKRLDGIYSCTIIDNQNGWTAAGKGTTPEFCLASGYAEAMEHFCNYCAYDTALLYPDSKNFLGFQRYPDEKMVDMNMLSSINPMVLTDIKTAFELEGDTYINDLASAAWKEFLKTDTFSLVPYYSVKDNTIVHLPESIIGKLCGSTGGGAGNTPEEAIGHALDEIGERYVKYIIYSEELTPPDIDRSFMKKHCSELSSVIETIERVANFKILVKDASLGKGYPVVAVCLINQDTHSYIVNFGAHPTFAVALERCLTEMFQFMSLENNNINRHKQMTIWSSFETTTHSIKNWTSLLRDDTGIVPDAFFANDFSWRFEPWGISNFYNNKKGLRQQIDTFISNGVKDIFIRNFSFLGCPVFRIYIPEVSFSHFTINDKTMRLFSESLQLVNSILNNSILELNNSEIKLLVEAFSNNTYVSTWILKGVNEKYIDLLYAALIKETEGEKQSLEVLRRINTDYSIALIEDINMRKKGVVIEKIDHIIQLFYGDYVTEIVKNWRDSEAFIKLILVLKKYGIMFEKDKTQYVESVQLTHCNFKKSMIDNLPSQRLIGDILKNCI